MEDLVAVAHFVCLAYRASWKDLRTHLTTIVGCFLVVVLQDGGIEDAVQGNAGAEVALFPPALFVGMHCRDVGESQSNPPPARWSAAWPGCADRSSSSSSPRGGCRH
eukprot:COSAG01_NODE_49522_length_371_cov_1.066176_1_plen_106_part_10